LLLGLAPITFTFGQAETGKNSVRVKCPDSNGRKDLLSVEKFYEKSSRNHNHFWKGFHRGGIPALLQGATDVAMSSRRISPQEIQTAVGQGKEFVERFVGYGGIVIVTDSSNPVNSLTVEQMRKILKGDYTRWNQVGGNNEPIKVFSVGQGTRGL